MGLERLLQPTEEFWPGWIAGVSSFEMTRRGKELDQKEMAVERCSPVVAIDSSHVRIGLKPSGDLGELEEG